MKTLFLLPILFLLCGCTIVDRDKPYPDVTVSRLLRIIDADVYLDGEPLLPQLNQRYCK